MNLTLILISVGGFCALLGIVWMISSEPPMPTYTNFPIPPPQSTTHPHERIRQVVEQAMQDDPHPDILREGRKVLRELDRIDTEAKRQQQNVCGECGDEAPADDYLCASCRETA